MLQQGRADGCTYNRVDLTRQESIIEHIQSFPTVESHYVRKSSNYEYLPDGLNLAKIYRLYLNWCSDRNKHPESKGLYYRVFTSRFNLKFNKLKKDACDNCTSYHNTPEESKTEKLIADYDAHIQEKNLARECKAMMKEKAKENDWITAAAFDMHKVLLLPHGETSSFYYSRRLKVQNLTVTELDCMKSYCY